MSPVETVMREQRKKIILAAGIIFAGLWLTLVAYLLTADKQPVTINPGTVAVHAPSAVAVGSTPSATFNGSRKGGALLRHTASAPQWSYVQPAPKASMSSTSMRIHQTSSATVHSIGGGGGGGMYTTSGGGNGGRGIRYTANAYSGSIYIPTTHNSVTEVGASTANDVTTSSSVRAAMPRRIKTAKKDGIPGYNEDPDPDEIETPIGDVAWGLMLLLAAGYGYHVFLRKRPQSKEAKR